MVKLKEAFSPMLCEEGTEEDLETEGYVAELKVDGVRCVIERGKDGIEIYSRKGTSWNSRLPDVLAPFNRIRAFYRLDGELCYIDSEGHMVFTGAQKRCQVSQPEKVRRYMHEYPLICFLFDITMLNGEDLTVLPYASRRRVLEHFIGLQNVLYGWNLRVVPVSKENKKLYLWSIEKGFEGVVLKKLSGTYQEGKRTNAWVKVKGREHTIHTLNNSSLEEPNEGSNSGWSETD